MCEIYHRVEFSTGLQLNFQLVFNWFATGFQLGWEDRLTDASLGRLLLFLCRQTIISGRDQTLSGGGRRYTKQTPTHCTVNAKLDTRREGSDATFCANTQPSCSPRVWSAASPSPRSKKYSTQSLWPEVALETDTTILRSEPHHSIDIQRDPNMEHLITMSTRFKTNPHMLAGMQTYTQK